MKKVYEEMNCVFCEGKDKLKPFKAVHVCESCIEYAKDIEMPKKKEK